MDIKYTRKDICDIARTYLDTPYHHQGRLKYVGVDCAGLIVEIMKEIGIFTPECDYTGYRMIPDGRTLLMHCSKVGKKKPKSEMKAGDVLLIRFDSAPQHVAMYLGNNEFIHSYKPTKKVELSKLDSNYKTGETWYEKVLFAFELEGIQEEE